MKSLLARRSIRRYTEEPISEEMSHQLLEAAMAAPSAGNQRPWHFVVLRDRETLNAITQCHPYAPMLKEAPLAVVVCGDPSLEKHQGFWVQDCAAATQNILIAAEALDLGSVWLGVYPEDDRVKAIQKLLGIPEGIVPLSIVAVGHPAERKPVPERFQPDRVHQEKWS